LEPAEIGCTKLGTQPTSSVLSSGAIVANDVGSVNIASTAQPGQLDVERGASAATTRNPDTW
jgi:hypothetical protein